MGWWPRGWMGAARRAKRAEKDGDLRRAAATYAEAGAWDDAARLWARIVEGAGPSTAEVVATVREAVGALRAGPAQVARPLAARAAEALGRELATREVSTRADEPLLLDRAGFLEAAGQHVEAGELWARLGRIEDAVRAWTAAGALERVEALLEQDAREERTRGEVETLLEGADAALRTGAVSDAEAALQRALALSPDRPELGERLEALRARRVSGRVITLRCGTERVVYAAKSPLVWGREGADVVLRGASLSRRHAALHVGAGRVAVSDLGSRNGTFLRGVPIGAEVALALPAELRLGDDTELALDRWGDGVSVRVTRGLEQGLVVLIGTSELAVQGAPGAKLRFGDRGAYLEPPASGCAIDGQVVRAAVELLRGHRVTLGEHTWEVG